MRRRAAVISLVLLAAACSGDDDNDSTSTATRAATSAPTTATADDGTTATTTSPPADLEAAALAVTEVASGLVSPVAAAWRSGDDRMYVAEQPGTVRIVDGGAPVGEPVLDIDVATGSEQGLLGLTFSPDGTKLYVDYTDPAGDTNVDEYTMDGDVADPGSRRPLLFVDQPYANHNGGDIRFGPDGMLYVALGDGGSGGDPEGRAQDLDELLGKILRIDPAPGPPDTAYTIPPDNPFVGQPNARPEIWMWGLRNPWRFSFDRENGDIWIGDVGQNAFEEIDYAPAGSSGVNWGWDLREGTHEFEGEPPAGAREPIYELSHDVGNCAVTGGYVYRGAAIPALRGAYVFADYCTGDLIGITEADGALAHERQFDAHVDEVTSFGEDPDGELYVLSRSGEIYRIDPV